MDDQEKIVKRTEAAVLDDIAAAIEPEIPKLPWTAASFKPLVEQACAALRQRAAALLKEVSDG